MEREVVQGELTFNGDGFQTDHIGGAASFREGQISDELILTMIRTVSVETLMRLGWQMPTSLEDLTRVINVVSPEQSVSEFAHGESRGFTIFELLIEDVRLYRAVAFPMKNEKNRYWLGTMAMVIKGEPEAQYLDEPDLMISSYVDRPRLN